jgi:hypothetical protein
LERRGEGLTTEDLAGTRADDEDLRIEEDGRSEADRSRADQMREDADPEAAGREPIAVGPAETAIIVEERRPAEPQADSDDPARAAALGGSNAGPAADRENEPAPATGESAAEKDGGRQQEDEATASRAGSDASRPLIAEANREEFVARWKEVQFRFVEEPRSAVQDADGLVAEVMQKVAQMFADERATLESQWSQGDQVSTEDLRLAFRRYREFFDRLLKA